MLHSYFSHLVVLTFMNMFSSHEYFVLSYEIFPLFFFLAYLLPMSVELSLPQISVYQFSTNFMMFSSDILT